LHNLFLEREHLGARRHPFMMLESDFSRGAGKDDASLFSKSVNAENNADGKADGG
jgi:hypothetical protein